MKLIIILNLIYFFGIVSAFAEEISFEKFYKNKNEERFAVPKIDGTFKWMTYQEAKLENDLIVTIPRRAKLNVVKFYLYTKENPMVGEIMDIHNRDQLKNSYFNPIHPTRFIIHGWRNNINSTVNILIRDAYLRRGNYNIIVVDWSAEAETINYIKSRFKVEKIGKKIAEFIDYLSIYGKLSYKDLHLIGHSLGAHICGFAGKNVKYGRIEIIFGLDPALPLFNYDKINERLSRYDAIYVETIHTNGGFLGFLKPIGKTSFYPNWGKKQPGCGLDIGRQCSHSRSYELFADAIENDYFIPQKCNSFDDINNEHCSDALKQKIYMGSYLNAVRNVKGIYYLPTNAQKPFIEV